MTIEIKETSVFRDGLLIATFHADANEVRSSETLAPTVKKAIKDAIGENADPKFIVEKSSESEIPPEPAMSKKLGDRTPAWAEWCRKYKPEEFARRFHETRPYDLNETDEDEE